MGRSHNLRGEPSLGLFVKKRNIGAPFWHAVLAVVLVERASREGKCGGCEQVPARTCTRTCRPPMAMGDGDRDVSWQVRAGGGGSMRRGARAQGRRGRYRGRPDSVWGVHVDMYLFDSIKGHEATYSS